MNSAIKLSSFCVSQVYNIPDALQPEAPMDASVFLNGKCWAHLREKGENLRHF